VSEASKGGRSEQRRTKRAKEDKLTMGKSAYGVKKKLVFR
jgi:hypothetical protein